MLELEALPVHCQNVLDSKSNKLICKVIYCYKRRNISHFGKLICLSQNNQSNGTDFGIICFILPKLSLYVWDHISKGNA